MKTFKLKALPLATAAALAMTSYAVSAQPLVSVTLNAAVSSTGLGPLTGAHSLGLEHTIDVASLNSSDSGNPLESLISGLQGSDGGGSDGMSTLPGLSDDPVSEQEGSEDAASADESSENELADSLTGALDNVVASLEDGMGDGDSANNPIAGAAEQLITTLTASFEQDGQQEQAPESEAQATDVEEGIDELTADESAQSEEQSSVEVFAEAGIRLDGADF